MFLNFAESKETFGAKPTSDDHPALRGRRWWREPLLSSFHTVTLLRWFRVVESNCLKDRPGMLHELVHPEKSSRQEHSAELLERAQPTQPSPGTAKRAASGTDAIMSSTTLEACTSQDEWSNLNREMTDDQLYAERLNQRLWDACLCKEPAVIFKCHGNLTWLIQLGGDDSEC
jgi:hypothetical protein